jgi:hypothetical protein
MINLDKPTTSFINSTKVSDGEIWATVSTTWLSETRTWGGIAHFITNTYTNFGFLWSVLNTPWTSLLPWSNIAGITNQSKP